jgi:hypothetical protein
MGDFNEIVNISNMRGTNNKAQQQILNDFQEALEDCQLCELGFSGPKYTWSNGREGVALTK